MKDICLNGMNDFEGISPCPTSYSGVRYAAWWTSHLQRSGFWFTILIDPVLDNVYRIPIG